MTRRFIPLLLIIVSLGACNPEGPTGPKTFSIFDVYGLWQLRMASPDCGPAQLFNMDFGPFGISATQDSIQVIGSWYLSEKNPETHKLTGYIYRDSGLAYFSLNDFDTKIVEGIFLSNKEFAGAYRELGTCVNRLRGKFLE